MRHYTYSVIMSKRLLLCLIFLSSLVGNLANASTSSFTGCPNDILVISDDFNETSRIPVIWDEPSLTDGNEGVHISKNLEPGSRFSWGCTDVTYTLNQTAKLAYCSFRICISDTTADTYVVSRNVSVQYERCPVGNIQIDNENSELSVEVLSEPDADDGNAVTEKPSDASFSFGCTKVTYTGQDASGRIATCTFMVCTGKAWATPLIIVVIIVLAISLSCVASCVMVIKFCK